MSHVIRVPRNLRIDIKDRLEEYSQSIVIPEVVRHPHFEVPYPQLKRGQQILGALVAVVQSFRYIHSNPAVVAWNVRALLVSRSLWSQKQRYWATFHFLLVIYKIFTEFACVCFFFAKKGAKLKAPPARNGPNTGSLAPEVRRRVNN